MVIKFDGSHHSNVSWVNRSWTMTLQCKYRVKVQHSLTDTDIPAKVVTPCSPTHCSGSQIASCIWYIVISEWSSPSGANISAECLISCWNRLFVADLIGYFANVKTVLGPNEPLVNSFTILTFQRFVRPYCQFEYISFESTRCVTREFQQELLIPPAVAAKSAIARSGA